MHYYFQKCRSQFRAPHTWTPPEAQQQNHEHREDVRDVAAIQRCTTIAESWQGELSAFGYEEADDLWSDFSCNVSETRAQSSTICFDYLDGIAYGVRPCR